MKENKLHSIQINRTLWRLIVGSPIVLGVIIYSISSTSMSYLLTPHTQLGGLLMMGLTLSGILIGFGFGLVLARLFKIRGIDYDKYI